jgi:charged multivesicular body protein 5
MKEASKQTQIQMGKINMDELEDIHDDMADMIADTEEINEIMCRDYAVDQFNEDEMMAGNNNAYIYICLL